MTEKEFNEIINDRLKKIVLTLRAKGKEYAYNDDRLHNFKRAAEMLRCSHEKALMGMLAKHMVSIMDMVDEVEAAGDNPYPMKLWEEKLGDAINYLILLEAIVKEK